MSDTPWTKGPWVIDEADGDDDESPIYFINGVADNMTVARTIRFTGRDEANARLISAAPDMAEALEAIVRAETDYANATVRRMANIARAALARAKGATT